MASKLYLIESEEREGLVKIGFAGGGNSQTPDADVVYNRVSDYATGISDPSKVHETTGSIIFEKYLHRFFEDNRKPVVIKFFRKTKEPREWFQLEPNTLPILIEAFSKEHPQRVDQVNRSDLPVFLSGVFSAIHWEAWYTSPERRAELAGIAAQENFITALERQRTDGNIGFSIPDSLIGQDVSGNTDLGIEQTETSPNPTIEDDFARRAIDSIGQAKALQVEISQIQEMEKGRTIIAMVSVVCVLFLCLFGTNVVGITIFSVLAFVLLARWPNMQPYLAAWAIDLWRWLQHSSERSRQRAGGRDE